MVAAPSKCRPSAAALVVAPPAAARRRLRCRCCEDTLGVPRRRLQQQLPAVPGLHLNHAQQQQQAAAPAPHLAPVAAPPPPPRPRRIVLVQHGESEGNVDEAAYTRVPDPRIGLTAQGWSDADDCGRRLRDLFAQDGDDWKVYFYVSPYRRSLETLRGMGHAFEPHRIVGVREEPRLREQDFGNFQDREQMRLEKEIRLRYGRFFYRFPNGESAADVYDRITGFRETLLADIDIGRFQPPGTTTTGDMNIVLVSHGLTLRVFLMRWYKWTVRQFEGLENLANGGALVMQTGDGGRYSLLVHHTADELRAFGLTEEMLQDQMWQKTAKPGELNHRFMTNGQSFFHPFTTIY
ncbi:phosphoglycerate mutase-like protein AT74H isoform X1 [Miscanthus floridulus]|uniref:phosphoglycerate mutase-like protein AT74H isoform X1 n=1 Tax=Miscanthus floridulus TaxID=154761 RepID=UPI00345798AF